MAITNGPSSNVYFGSRNSSTASMVITTSDAVFEGADTQKQVNADLGQQIVDSTIMTNPSDNSKWKLGFNTAGEFGLVKVV